ncbi:hypothetical protein ACFT7S_37385 [Streptomyces sp. NPDC057136]|uniref:hypothetical protein n=1 Tax=Streptomyces sp. NPDC057136 TaxID=3346029 RepID=UPI003640311D
MDQAALNAPVVTRALPAGHTVVKGAVVAVADLGDCHMDDVGSSGYQKLRNGVQ